MSLNLAHSSTVAAIVANLSTSPDGEVTLDGVVVGSIQSREGLMDDGWMSPGVIDALRDHPEGDEIRRLLWEEAGWL